MYFFERYKQNPEEAMVRMIACGGDCDTLASMIGCLLGARYGKGWIPERWTEPLKRKDIVSHGEKLSLLCCKQVVRNEKLCEEVKEKLKTMKIPKRHT